MTQIIKTNKNNNYYMNIINNYLKNVFIIFIVYKYCLLHNN